jgi:hypothetical protein
VLRRAVLAREHEAPVRAEPVARSEDGDRLRSQVRVAALTVAARRKLGQVGDDQVEVSRDRLQQVALDEKGALVLQYRAAILEASRTELTGLLSEHEEAAESLSAEGRRARAA